LLKKSFIFVKVNRENHFALYSEFLLFKRLVKAALFFDYICPMAFYKT